MSYTTGLTRLAAREGGFGDWTLEGARLAEGGGLVLDPELASAAVSSGSAPACGERILGEATSPALPADFPFVDLIPSWNASTPRGSWIEVLLRANSSAKWTAWYNLGVWAEDSSTIERHSVAGQDDDEGRVAADTLSLKVAADHMQVKVRFFGSGAATPLLRAVALAYSTTKPASPAGHARGDPSLWGRILPGVPEVSQMEYPKGGNVWCSPTAVSMVLGYWAGSKGDRDGRVLEAVEGVFDPVFGGHGNWSFNAAYAATKGHDAYIARFPSLSRLEPFIAAGIPVVMSLSWNEEKGRLLAGAPVSSSRGHLTLLVGFDREGNPVMNEPASRSHAEVRRNYRRSELEARWLEASGGTVYLIHPPGKGFA
jgi:hypothetical protein